MASEAGNLPPKSAQDTNSTTRFFNNYFDNTFNATSPNINDAVIGYFQTVTGDKDTGTTLGTTVIYTAIQQGIDPMSLVDQFRALPSGTKTQVKTPIPNTSVVTTYTTFANVVLNKNAFPVGQVFYANVDAKFYQSYFGEVTSAITTTNTFASNVFDANNIQVQQQRIFAGQPQLGTVYTQDEPKFLTPDTPFPKANANVTVASSSSDESIQARSTQTATVQQDYTPIEFNNPAGLEEPSQEMVKSYLNTSIKIQAAPNYQRDTVSLGGGKFEYSYSYITFTQEKDELTPYLTVLLNQNRVNTSLLGISQNPPVNKYVSRSILS